MGSAYDLHHLILGSHNIRTHTLTLELRRKKMPSHRQETENDAVIHGPTDATKGTVTTTSLYLDWGGEGGDDITKIPLLKH